jgi:hypothetical protein
VKDREWRVQMEAELVTLRRRVAAVEAALAKLLPATPPRRRTRPTGNAPFGWRRDETGRLLAVPEQQAAIRQIQRMKERGLSLREIAAAMRGVGIKISHMTVRNVLVAASSGPTTGELIEGGHVYVPGGRYARHPNTHDAAGPTRRFARSSRSTKVDR